MADTRSTRLEHIDMGAGIMILWLLWYHALWPLYESRVLETVPWLFFFMPWFFYKSGYFFSQKPIKATIKKDARKLLRQYAIWSIIGYACYIITLSLYDELTFKTIVYRPLLSLVKIGAIPVNRSLWFLSVLYIVHQLENVISRRFNILWLSLISMMIAIGLHVSHLSEICRPVYATAWGLFFFCSGAYLRQYEQNKYVIGISAIIMLFTYLFTTTPIVYDQHVEWYMYINWYPACIAGCVILNNVCHWIVRLGTINIVKKYDILIPTLKWVGRHSMMIYVVQGIVYVMVHDWMFYCHPQLYDTWSGVLILWIIYIVVIIPLCLISDRLQKKNSSII